MRRLLRTLLTCCLTLNASCSAATTVTPQPLLGSTQSIVHSPFCKKYMCRALPVSQGGGFSIYLYDHLDAEMTRVDFKFDKNKQFLYAEFQLSESFYDDRGVTERESSMLHDFYKAATGKALPLGISVSQGERYSEDVTHCIEDAKSQKSKRYVYSKTGLQMVKTKAREDASLECYTGSESLKPGRYQPVVSIGFKNRINDLVNDKIDY